MPENAGGNLAQAALSIPCPAGWEQARKRAREKIAATPLPSKEMEDWKYLDLAPVRAATFLNVAAQTVRQPIGPSVLESLAPETSGSRLVFSNGVLEPALSDTGALPGGVVFSGLRDGPGTALSRLGGLAQPEASDLFADLNMALFCDGAVIHVPAGLELETPLHVVFHSSGAESGGLPIVCPRILVVLGPGAKAHLVEEYRGCGKYLTSSVVEIFLGDGSSLRHDRVQREGGGAFHFCSLWAELGKAAFYGSTLISTGAALSRQSPKAVFTGENAELELNGLTTIGAEQAAAPASQAGQVAAPASQAGQVAAPASQAGQVADTHSLIDHAVPGCASRQLQKFIVAGAARGVFNGRIVVRQGAQGTEASQSSRNLLLGEGRMDAKPQLEILADDVKCGHGATVGQLDAEGLFYLQSRGLDLASAQNLLLAGFAADVLNRLALPSVASASHPIRLLGGHKKEGWKECF